MKKLSPQKWISMNFGEEPVCTNAGKKIKRAKIKSKSCDNREASTFLKRSFNFETALVPQSLADLAVHSKKLEELEYWLHNNVVKRNQNETKASFLLVTGPTGCGKTMALNILCSKLGISMSEWINPVDQNFEFGCWSNQVERFTEFLTESRYNSLFDIAENKKVVLVEDYPNAVVYRPEEFFNILDMCSFKTRYSIVFICNDSLVKNGIQLSRLLFPEEIVTKYKIHNISFNACADTLMKGALKRAQKVVESNPDILKLPSTNTISAIITSSMGDIRCAMNQYYLASLLNSKELPVETTNCEKPGAKRKRKVAISKVVSMSRDETLGLFHGLGRVLNPKRKEVGDGWRLNCDVEKLIDEFSIQPSTFTAFLFENYIKYFGDLYELSAASDMLSLSEAFLGNWGDKNDTMVFALWISVLGLMVTNEHRLSRWTQIRGPRKIPVVLNQNARTQKLSPIDSYYYNVIHKSNTFHKFTFKK